MASIKTKTGTLKRNLSDKLKVSNAEILAFSDARQLHRSMSYRSRLMISTFDARGSRYVTERIFTKFSEITPSVPCISISRVQTRTLSSSIKQKVLHKLAVL